MTEHGIREVSDTAFMAAAYRARESDRPDALFHDPLARALSGERGERILDTLPKAATLGGWTVVIRTRIIDELIADAIREGVDTIVNLGAGLDARPYRMDLPESLRWVEADYAHVIDRKEERLAGERPRCRLERVRLDLGDDVARRALLARLAARSENILVLTEAVTPYLAEGAVAALAEDLRSVGSVRHWLVDYFSPASYRHRRRSGLSRAMKNAPFLFEPADYFGFFARVGWRAKEVRYLAVEAERLRRPAPFPRVIRIASWLASRLASEDRRREMMRYAGFALFEPASRTGDAES